MYSRMYVALVAFVLAGVPFSFTAADGPVRGPASTSNIDSRISGSTELLPTRSFARVTFRRHRTARVHRRYWVYSSPGYAMILGVRN